MTNKLTAMACAAGAMFIASAANAAVTGATVELYEGADWAANGYAGLDTYRVYVLFDNETDQLNAIFGNAANPMSFMSTDGAFHNDAGADSLTAPADLTGPPFNYWDNQWDTYVTIDTTQNAGDATGLTPGFGAQVGNLVGDFTADNASWFVTPADLPQGEADGFRVLIAQLTVAQGTHVSGVFNAQIAGGAQTLGLEFNSIPTPGALALLGLAGLVGARRRRG